MLIVVWFAFEDLFNGVYVISSTNLDYFRRWKLSKVHSAKSQYCGRHDQNSLPRHVPVSLPARIQCTTDQKLESGG